MIIPYSLPAVGLCGAQYPDIGLGLGWSHRMFFQFLLAIELTIDFQLFSPDMKLLTRSMLPMSE